MKLSEAKTLLETGYTCAEIAKLAGVKPNEIREALGIDAAYVKRLAEAGHSRTEIQRLTGADYKWVDSRIGDHGAKLKNGRIKIDWSLAPELYREGKNDAEIAFALGCTPPAVSKWRKRNGLKSNWWRV